MHLEEVGDGQRVGFCYDRWYGNHALKEVYPKLFSIVALPLVHMELVCGKILEGGDTLYLGFFCLKLEMVQKCSFG